MSYPASVNVLNLAQRLIDQARRGELAARQPNLFRMAQRDPRLAADLLRVLLELAAMDRPPLMDEARRKRLREAHAAWERGERADWVVEGHREYERDRKRLYRWRQLCAGQTERQRAG